MISTDRFHWHSDTKTFSAEMSDIQELNYLQAHPDASDIGFDIQSAKTGKVIRVVNTHDELDREGDILWTEFRPANREFRNLFRVQIFND